jgi:glutaredoxin
MSMLDRIFRRKRPPQVTIYTQPACADRRAAKKFFAHNGISFTEGHNHG